MALPLSERGPAPTPKPAPTRAPSAGRFDGGAVSRARELLATAIRREDQDPQTHLVEAFRAAYDGDPGNNPTLGDPEDSGFLQLAVRNGTAPDPLARHNEPSVGEAQTMLEDALEAQRQAAIGDGEQALNKPIAKQVDRMTAAEYEALSPLERAAVDFNGMLVQAVRKDRHNQDEYSPTKQQRAIYDQSVEKIFGEDGSSEMYAPETLGLLRQLDFKDDAGDLDDFLGLTAAIRTEDLPDLARSSAPPAVTGGVAEDSRLSDTDFDQLALQRNLAESTQTLQSALVRGNELLQTLGAMARVERSNDVTRNLGGLPNQVNATLGYGTAVDDRGELTLDGYFQQSFDRLAAKDGVSTESKLAALNADLSGEEFQAFLNYAAERAGTAERYGIELGSGEGVKYLKPEEFRELLSGKKGKTDGAS